MSDLEIGVKMVWTALQMTPQYRTAGLCLARIYCSEKGLDDLEIERAIKRADAQRGGSGSFDDAMREVRASC